MRESAQAALSLRAQPRRSSRRTSTTTGSPRHDIHIHVPAGAVPKDGPSAGVAMAAALASLISGRPVRNDIAMTGEVTLTGQVLPIGGVKEKALAAQRAGIKRVIVPGRNEEDIEEIPEHERKDLEFIFVDEVEGARGRPRERRGAQAPRVALPACGYILSQGDRARELRNGEQHTRDPGGRPRRQPLRRRATTRTCSA